jgi:ABC-type transport system substrate-binding protein
MLRSQRSGLPRYLAVVVVALGLAATAACGAGGKTGKTASETLTVGLPTPPTTLNPAKAVLLHPVFYAAYEPLIYQAGDQGGTGYRAGLAASYGYAAGSGNRVFDITLRPNLRFSDGSPMTAQSVVDSLAYWKTAEGPFASIAKTFGSVVAVSDKQVQIRLSKPSPIMPLNMVSMGMVIGPVGLKSPNALDTHTDGAGPYMLDPAKTVTGDHYTFVQNPYYYNKSRVKYKKYVVKIIPDSNAAFQALKVGQIDWVAGDISTVEAAGSAGLQIAHAPLGVQWLGLFDREGKLNKALGDVRVRQALNYAIDRNAIVNAVFGKYARPTDQPTIIGATGYDPTLEGYYKYDPQKAKRLLSDAGYGGGLKLTVLSTPGPPTHSDELLQALNQYYAKVGVSVTLKIEPFQQYFSELHSGKYSAATAFRGGPLSTWAAAPISLQPDGSLNPFHVSDPTISKLLDRIALADAAGEVEMSNQLERYLVEQAWFVPLCDFDSIFYADKHVGGFKLTAAAQYPIIFDTYPQ